MTLSTTTIDRALLPLAPTDCLRLGVLASGRGTNLQALLDAETARTIPARVVAVASNRRNAPAIERAERARVSAAAFPRSAFSSHAEQERAMIDFLREQRVELVVLAGYVPILGEAMLTAFPNRIVNIHPSLLPAFGNTLHAQAEALRHGVKISGCTIHFVTNLVDSGPIIVQRAVPVLETDTEDTLAQRILAEEHIALREAIRLIAAGRVLIEGSRTRILAAS